MTEQQIEIWTDYHSFYIRDDSEAGMVWGKGEDVDGLSVLGPSYAAVRVGRNGKLPTQVRIFDHAAGCGDFQTWSVVNECSLEFSSGRVCIAGSTDIPDESNIVKLSRSWYRVRVCFTTIEGPEFDYEMDDEEDANREQGRCLIEPWPAEYAPIQSVKFTE